MRSQIENAVVVVTGAGSGIGRAIALHAADAGALLALTDIREDALSRVADEAERRGARCIEKTADVSDFAQVEAFAEHTRDSFGRADIVVNNAGVNVYGAFEETSLEDMRWILGINYWGVVHGCKSFLPLLRRSDRGHIVNISSMAGMIGIPNQTSYSAGKFAVRGFSAGLRAELAASGIGVSTIMPGAIRTPLMSRARSTNQSATDRMAKLMMRFAPPAERVAERVFDAVEKNTAEVCICAESHATRVVQSIAPGLARGALALGFRTTRRRR